MSDGTSENTIEKLARFAVVEAAKQAETLGAWTYELSDALRSLNKTE